MIVVVHGGLYGRHGQVLQIVSATDGYGNRGGTARADQFGQLFFGRNFLPVNRKNDISFLYTSFFGGIDRLALHIGYIAGSHYHNTVCYHLDAKRCTTQRNDATINHLDIDILNVD